MDTLLLLEDDPILHEIIAEYLQEHGYTVEGFFDGERALDAIRAGSYAMLLLDVRVPELNGFELLSYLREIQNTTPAIFITSLSGIKDLQKGFRLGANDYLKKPFELEELRIRIEHQLATLQHREKLQLGAFTFLPQRQCLVCEEKKFSLRHKEAQILHYLARQQGRVISFEELIENIWDAEQIPAYATIRTYIKNLRKIMGGDAIENIKGSGYRLNLA